MPGAAGRFDATAFSGGEGEFEGERGGSGAGRDDGRRSQALDVLQAPANRGRVQRGGSRVDARFSPDWRAIRAPSDLRALKNNNSRAHL